MWCMFVIVTRVDVGASCMVLVYECFVMQMVYGCVLCASCGSSKCCIQCVNAGHGCNMRPYGRGISKNQSHDCLILRNHACRLLFTPSCYYECFYHL